MLRTRIVITLALVLTRFASPATAAETKAFVVCTDYMDGTLGTVDLATRAVTPDLTSINSDAVARWYDGLLYVVNRFGGDNIQVIDPSAGYTTLRQFSVGNGSNPQDIAFVSPAKAYVSRYGSASIAIVNPATGGSLGSISLAPFADSDGLPEMARMVRVGRWLFVACQRLTGYQPVNPSVIAVVDTQADTVFDVDPGTPGVQAIPLTFRNPVTTFEFDRTRTRLLIGCVGAIGALDGGIEAIDPVALRDLGPVATEAALGGDVSDIALRDASHAYVIVSSASDNVLRSWNPATGDTIGTLFHVGGGYSLPDMELDDRGELYVCWNDLYTPGLVVFSTATDLPIAGPLSTGLPPVAVTFDHATDAVLAVSPPRPATAQVALSAAWPNPATTTVRLTLELANAGDTQVDVWDVAGRRVRTLARGVRPPGRETIVWDLRDDTGRPLGSGLYLVRARLGAGVDTRRVTVTR